MGNRYVASDPEHRIHIIEKGGREKGCDVCGTDLVEEKDTMLMFDTSAEGYDISMYLCYQCFNTAAGLVKRVNAAEWIESKEGK